MVLILITEPKNVNEVLTVVAFSLGRVEAQP